MSGLEMDLPFRKKMWVGDVADVDNLDSVRRSRAIFSAFDSGSVFSVGAGGLALSVSRERPPLDSHLMTFVPTDPRFGHVEESGLGSARLTGRDASIELPGVSSPQFIIVDKEVTCSILLPSKSPRAEMSWKWFAQNGIVYRLTVWCSDLDL
ncbi:hypothetical protein GCM10009858_44350 [Terrabacter carboxydivorans]|uniref:Uncharacterized protein n=1 Tax=Terrabacter carboxydivorans TaxID=619730 RepID=A0ABP5ZS86_9MICO